VTSLVATRPILVWKALKRVTSNEGVTYRSPYKEKMYRMGFRYRTSTMWIRKTSWWDTANINEGLHACLSIKAAKLHGTHGLVFPAIIPVGSRVWFGKGHTVAANQLIVYYALEDIENVHGSITDPKKWQEVTREPTSAEE
jgi:hypothetical protein